MVPSWCYCPGVSASASAEKSGLCMCYLTQMDPYWDSKWCHDSLHPRPPLNSVYQGSLQGSKSIYTNLQILFTGSEYFRVWDVLKYNQSSLFNYLTGAHQCMFNFLPVFCYCK